MEYDVLLDRLCRIDAVHSRSNGGAAPETARSKKTKDRELIPVFEALTHLLTFGPRGKVIPERVSVLNAVLTRFDGELTKDRVASLFDELMKLAMSKDERARW